MVFFVLLIQHFVASIIAVLKKKQNTPTADITGCSSTDTYTKAGAVTC
ncbi:hypothetical protein PC119_g27342 [Phytophthora cactorum]|nr:hypothetical protein PC119_g27342 [Phytophthora cactorum]